LCLADLLCLKKEDALFLRKYLPPFLAWAGFVTFKGQISVRALCHAPLLKSSTEQFSLASRLRQVRTRGTRFHQNKVRIRGTFLIFRFKRHHVFMTWVHCKFSNFHSLPFTFYRSLIQAKQSFIQAKLTYLKQG